MNESTIMFGKRKMQIYCQPQSDEIEFQLFQNKLKLHI